MSFFSREDATRSPIVAFLCLFAASVVPADPLKLEAVASPLEGSRFRVTVSPGEGVPKETPPFDETMVFEGGRVRMSGYEKVGFAAAPYSLMPSAAGFSFRTVQKSDKEGICVWTAEIEGTVVRGTLTWSPKGGPAVVYSFEGRKVTRQEDAR